MTEHIPAPDEVDALTPGEYKTFENRLRRVAQRQGYRLEKSRRRDPYALDYGTYRLINMDVNGVMYHANGVHLAQIAEFLWGGEDDEAGTA
jgi:hypothetical protein